MPTILWENRGSRCDSTCHNAESDKDTCQCCCAGAYHGAGVEARARMLEDLDAGRLTDEQVEAVRMAEMTHRKREKYLRQKAYRERRDQMRGAR